MAEGEWVVFTGRCSSADRDRVLSLVGGDVCVTSTRLVFMPNRLAALFGRRPWVLRLDQIGRTSAEDLDLRGWPGPLRALRIYPTWPSDGVGSAARTVVMARPELVAELLKAIEAAQGDR